MRRELCVNFLAEEFFYLICLSSVLIPDAGSEETFNITRDLRTFKVDRTCLLHVQMTLSPGGQLLKRNTPKEG